MFDEFTFMESRLHLNKTFVLDTNVILQTPFSFLMFEDNTVVIPEVVLEELDKFKKDRTELGVNARQAGRLLDKIMQMGDLSEGVKLDNGGELRVELNFENVHLPQSWKKDVNDNRILCVCKGLKERGENVYLVTRDTFARIKAQLIGVSTQDFMAEQGPTIDDQYKGREEVFAPKNEIAAFYKNGWIESDVIYKVDEDGKKYKPDIYVNEFFIIHGDENVRQSALCRYDGKKLVKLEYLDANPFGVTPRNIGQKFMQEALMGDVEKMPLVLIKGPGGHGKDVLYTGSGASQDFGRPRASLQEDTRMPAQCEV